MFRSPEAKAAGSWCEGIMSSDYDYRLVVDGSYINFWHPIISVHQVRTRGSWECGADSESFRLASLMYLFTCQWGGGSSSKLLQPMAATGQLAAAPDTAWAYCRNKKADDQDILNYLVDVDLTFQRANRLKQYGIPGVESVAHLQKAVVWVYGSAGIPQESKRRRGVDPASGWVGASISGWCPGSLGSPLF